MISFSNTYIGLPENFYQRVSSAYFKNPELISFNRTLANELAILYEGYNDQDLAQIFSGQKILEGSVPIAQAYAGHQFGHAVAQLGDGRALLLGETRGHDIQLKGSGQTKFSRQGDGRSALGPVIREYIVSEAMHNLGVPTTRALCAVTTGEMVYRQEGPEPGGIFTRVALSHLRVGTFQYFAFRNDLDSVKILLDYTLNRHYPQIAKLSSYREKSLAFLKKLIDLQSDLIAQWSALGFIHGVMNTDNFSVAGITIDYGPCAFMDEFGFNKVFSFIDKHGRYSYFNQVPIAKWNIWRLAECLLPLIDHDPDLAVKITEEEISTFMNVFDQKRMVKLAAKLGIRDYQSQDEELVMKFLTYLEENSLDFTLSFRNLPTLHAGDKSFYPDSPNFRTFLKLWNDRVKDVSQLNHINPLIIPRNHQIQKAILNANQGDFEHFHKILQAYAKPFESSPQFQEFSLPPRPEEQICQTFCGT